MPRRDDGMVPLEPALRGYEPSDPWQHEQGESPHYAPDYDLLSDLLTIPMRSQRVSESGVFAKATDLWLSMELRRSGFTDQETWPRPAVPRVLPRDVATLVNGLPQRVADLAGLRFRDEVWRRLAEMPQVTPTDARILGRAYEKQVDVCISRWKTGPEVLISTKTQVSSFAKNLPNRFEEALGDATNLQARHPLAATGYFFLQRSTILHDEPAAFERAKDMMLKLRSGDGGPGYTATGLCLVEWDDAAPETTVSVRLDEVPDELRPGNFLKHLITQVLKATPVTYHTTVRERYERRVIPVDEAHAGRGNEL